MLGWVWLLSLVYAMMSDQLVSKVVDKPCSVREEISGALGALSLTTGLIIPVLMGPVSAMLATLVINLISPILSITLDQEQEEESKR